MSSFPFPISEREKKFGPCYQIIGIGKTQDGKNWRIDLGIRKSWPFYLWYEYHGIPSPVETFIGSGYAWYRLEDGRSYGCGDLVPALNAIISECILDLIS